MKEKIKIRGSLYGVPSTEFSQEKEIAELVQRMPTMITKPNNLFEKGELEAKYKIYQDKTAMIQIEEEMKKLREEALGQSPSNLPGLSGLEDFEPIGSKTGANIFMAGNQHQLQVGKPQRQIVQSLDQKEKEVLQQMIQEELERYEYVVNRKYHPDYNSRCLSLLII